MDIDLTDALARAPQDIQEAEARMAELRLAVVANERAMAHYTTPNDLRRRQCEKRIAEAKEELETWETFIRITKDLVADSATPSV